MTISETSRNIVARMTPLYGDREARWMARIILEHLTGKTEADLLIHGDDPMSDFMEGKVNDILARLANHEPLQYILGEAWFHGYTFKVTPATLIPRPETAHLVDIVIKGAAGRSDLAVLDLGTGCGCIAITLALCLRFPVVTAVDNSKDALDVARENAERLKAKVDFEDEDILKMKPDGTQYDIIVSNPPYIVESERKEMEPNVLDYEPSLALFVPDSDPLRYYRAIAVYAREALVNNGLLYFEINPLYATQARDLLEGEGFVESYLMRDAQGKYRFLSAIKP